MKGLFVVFCLVVSAFALINPIYEEWEKWKNEYRPQYLTNEEHDKRFRIFSENKRKVLELNEKYAHVHNGPRFGLTQFADLTSEEFAARYLQQVPPQSHSILPSSMKGMDDYPKRKDWREEGAVNPVISQDACSCWPFPSTGNMEGVYKIAHGELPVLSVQQLIDCDHDCMMYMGKERCNQGCLTGLMPNAMSYAVREGMTTESEYPYTGSTDACKYTHTGTIYKFKNWYMVNNTEDAIVAALNDVGPLAVGIDATDLQLYTGGIFQGECSTTMNHGMLLVGYDIEDDIPYWILKNSWGMVWGEKGYLRLARGSDECGVNDFISTVVA